MKSWLVYEITQLYLYEAVPLSKGLGVQPLQVMVVMTIWSNTTAQETEVLLASFLVPWLEV